MCLPNLAYSFIGNPDFFTQNALNESILRLSHRPSFLLLTEANEGSNDYFTKDYYFLSDSDETLECQSQIILKVRHLFRFTLVASCNGLLCFSDKSLNIIYMWNPATSDTPKSLPLHPFQDPHSLQVDTVGFGFDRRSNDFKVLTISHVRSSHNACFFFNHQFTSNRKYIA